MKPHHLCIEGFGPYAQLAEIEFDDLAADGLFLIYGPTGSGKTFLLDAITFALYGEVAGERGQHTLKSDHGDPRLAPRLTFEFSAQGYRYLIERTATHKVPKVRGDGETTKQGTVALFRLDGAVPTPIAASIAEVRLEVERLVGLDASQFKQVVLLPQGQFEKVLRAGSGDREKLLKTLFESDLYDRVTAWLEEHAKAARRRVHEGEESLVVIREQASREWEPFTTSESPVIADQDALDSAAAEIAKVLAAASVGVTSAFAKQKHSQENKSQMEALVQRWDRRAVAQARLEVLAERSTQIEIDRVVRASAISAEQLRAVVAAEGSARAQSEKSDAMIAESLKEARDVRAGITRLPEEIVCLDLQTVPNLNDFIAAANLLTAHRTRLEELGNKSDQADAKAVLAKEFLTVEAHQKGLVSAGEAEAKTAREDLEIFAAALVVARSASDRLAGLTQVAISARSKSDAVVALEAANQEALVAAQITESALGEASRARSEAGRARERYLEGIAAAMASELADGVGCLVCGSPEHPSPASASADSITKDAWDAEERKATKAQERAAAASESSVSHKVLVAELQSKVGELGLSSQEAVALAAAASGELAAAQTTAAEVGSIEEKLAKAEKRLAAISPQGDAAGKAAAAAGQSALGNLAEATAIRDEIAKQIGEGVTPFDALGELGPFCEVIDLLLSAITSGIVASTELKSASGNLGGAIAASQFSSTQEVASALRSQEVVAGLTLSIKEYDDEKLKHLGVLESPDLKDLPDEKPALADSLVLLEASEKAYAQAVEKQKGASDANDALVRLACEHQSLNTSLGEQINTSNIANAVADRCSGKTAPKVSLQRWILAAYLEDICTYANSRLGKMTSGRYQIRVHRESEREGKQAGLGLRVLDAFTGDEREVSTLSGGETFQASLALALGVADAVQAHSGGVHLDALFIDEGFGTLDSENLQLAMDELDRLREGGRMVGIISHVGELRERIRSGIEVIATDHGSTVRVGEMTR